jgi:SPP1 gp7 family putative phage head morphogenesis protein
MIDVANLETEATLKELEKQITKVYKQAAEEVSEKLNDYLRRFKIKDEIKRKKLKSGEITRKDYVEWRKNQIAMGKRWETLRGDLANTYANADVAAMKMIEFYMPLVYANNYNYGTYNAELLSGVDTSFTLYDYDAVARLMIEDPTMLPPPGKAVSEEIRLGLAQRWNNKQIQSVMLQSILQGEAIPAIATRLALAVGDKDRKAAIRNARTMTTNAQNSGRLNAFRRADGMGIDIKKQWIATLDGRTRHSHRQLDGEIRDLDEKFSNGCNNPGDPSAKPEEVYCCRCRMLGVLKGFEIDVKDLSLRNTNHFEYESYEEWRKGHGVSQNILHQDEMAARMRVATIVRDYL